MWVGSQVTNRGRGTEVLLEEPLPLETARESPSFKLEPLETERSPGPRLQELLGPSPTGDPQAVKERGEEQLFGRMGGRRGLGLPLTLEGCSTGAKEKDFVNLKSLELECKTQKWWCGVLGGIGKGKILIKPHLYAEQKIFRAR